MEPHGKDERVEAALGQAESGIGSNSDRYDFIVAGGGIVGLSTALAISRRWPGKSVAVLEKEHELARHQTGRNSGVVHSGIYYKPGSLKARLARRGGALLKDFCQEHGVTFDERGKVIVATNAAEAVRLTKLYERGVENGVPGNRLIDSAELNEIEPNATGVQAIHSPSTAIVDYAEVSEKIATVLKASGADVLLGRRISAIESGARGSVVRGPGFEIRAGFVVNCGGLYSDNLARMSGLAPRVRIVPFRGEYYLLRPESQGLVNGPIYPVPDPALPFLGVHFTSTVDGKVEAGPNAVLALAREGYRNTDINVREALETLSYRGFWKLAMAHWPVGLFEVYRSLFKAAFVNSLRKLVPAVESTDLVRGHTGVRAQAVDSRGRLVDDFVIHESENSLHVLNAPSPAATAGLAIGEYIAARISEQA